MALNVRYRFREFLVIINSANRIETSIMYSNNKTDQNKSCHEISFVSRAFF